MKNKILILYLLFITTFSVNSIKAQETIPASGGEATGIGGSVSYSFGQILYTTNTGINGSVAGGVQQPLEISVVTAIDEANGINLTVMAYPNPTTNYLIVTVDSEMDFPFTAQLFDSKGQMVGSEKITKQETKIDMRLMLQAAYFLKVTQKDKEIKTFKIIKTQ